jgi:hypothetical protein
MALTYIVEKIISRTNVQLQASGYPNSTAQKQGAKRPIYWQLCIAVVRKSAKKWPEPETGWLEVNQGTPQRGKYREKT